MVLAKTISKKNQLMSVATKIGIQLNAKLGGEIWGVTIPVSEILCEGSVEYLILVENVNGYWYGFIS
jgi:hypothetical protein